MTTPQLATIKRVTLGPQHHASLAKHSISGGQGVRNINAFVELEIAVCPGESSCYLFHTSADGQMTDTWHESVEDALDQAEWEFGVLPDDWSTTAPPGTS
jgi:hypothetical protein